LQSFKVALKFLLCCSFPRIIERKLFLKGGNVIAAGIEEWGWGNGMLFLEN
jgi:hypothetical protein